MHGHVQTPTPAQQYKVQGQNSNNAFVTRSTPNQESENRKRQCQLATYLRVELENGGCHEQKRDDFNRLVQPVTRTVVRQVTFELKD